MIKKKQILEQKIKYAKFAGYDLNHDKKDLDFIIKGLYANLKKYGVQYCPCRIISGNKKEDLKKICPCFWHKEEIKKDGYCHCHLFFKK